MADDDTELSRIEERYARRAEQGKAALYDPLLPVNVAFRQEREKALTTMLRKLLRGRPLSSLKILEVGCGTGGNLASLISWGANPENCVGNELLENRADAARRVLPSSVIIVQGDAAKLDFPEGSFDIILQSTVFSSILDENVRRKVAQNMWRILHAQGGILWYDFVIDNPRNPDVVGIRQADIKALFPDAYYTSAKVTLAPPIARWLVRLSARIYPLVNSMPFLRTHVVALLQKR